MIALVNTIISSIYVRAIENIVQYPKLFDGMQWNAHQIIYVPPAKGIPVNAWQYVAAFGVNVIYECWTAPGFGAERNPHRLQGEGLLAASHRKFRTFLKS
jgi:hypothetical protein